MQNALRPTKIIYLTYDLLFFQYFESRVAPKVCQKDYSIEENRVKALADFFGESCKPGVWAADPKVDDELSKYLCNYAVSMVWEYILFV